MNFDDVAIAFVKEGDYGIYFWYMCKDDAINIVKNSDLNEKSDFLQIFFLNIKMIVSIINSFIIKEIMKKILKAKEYYENNKARIRDQCQK